ncbi:Xaa-Pro peptidase family protein [Geobacter pelophilus]|uniref:Xaa-Pro peptidase family protein n=1 Tax=Geoanaerobacter pelophilus TaxID=60036 RepID=A0AAW4L3V7_9BACT|nr:Xaa-Pro peptidase family protein [Geoanaerobacter pelophilus]MBT0665643.1 Xaa-Pro peptidase family protein [Geoanaerobacter pelophilus]
MLKDRIFSARECLERNSIDALLVTSLQSIRYLSGFSGSDGVLLVTPDAGCFLTDSRYTTQASREVSGFAVAEYRSKLDAVVEWFSACGCRRIGFIASQLTVEVYDELKAKLPEVEFVALKDELADIRRIKSHEEIVLLETAASLASEAFLSILPLIRPGISERELALELEVAMRRQGADDKAFDFIVASGERGALPHGRASERVICQGELITFDFGAICNGYNSDETVTVALGSPDPQLLDIFSIVKEAHDRAIDAVKPGVPLKDLDRIARSFIAEKGFGSFFGHGLGHGVGLEVHEKPLVSFRSDEIAAEGMVFTIEPGIYVPGLGGVRIEDTVVVEASGCRLLTKVSKELRVL